VYVGVCVCVCVCERSLHTTITCCSTQHNRQTHFVDLENIELTLTSLLLTFRPTIRYVRFSECLYLRARRRLVWGCRCKRSRSVLIVCRCRRVVRVCQHE
jgi:hypothetical protein